MSSEHAARRMRWGEKEAKMNYAYENKMERMNWRRIKKKLSSEKIRKQEEWRRSARERILLNTCIAALPVAYKRVINVCCRGSDPSV